LGNNADLSDSRHAGTAKVRLAPLVKPVGAVSSGPSRLSDQPSSIKAVGYECTAEDRRGETDHRESNRSKFFSGSRRTKRPAQVIEVVQQESIELVWEKSDEAPEVEPDRPVAGPSSVSRSLSPDHIPSPSPIVSPLRVETSPPKPLPFSDGVHFSSPPGSELSSPPSYSPSNNDPFSSPRKRPRLRSASPLSPTRTNPPPKPVVLIAPSSLPPDSTQHLPTSQMLSDQTPTKRDRAGRAVSRLSSVIIPGSSPSGSKVQPVPQAEPFDLRQLCRISEISSDSIEEEQVVTPSAEVIGKRKFEEQGQADKEREERAKIVAAGWKNKYAFKADIVRRADHSRTSS